MLYKYITKNKEFEEFLAKLTALKAISIDLEFDKNRYAYGFNLCLLQINTGEDCFLIDPLSKDINIKKVFPVLENSAVQKLVFAFGEDLRLLHSLGCFPKNLFDIAMAAKLLNYPPGSLAALAEEILGIQMNKSSQNSNWLKRPLTENQLEYAALDVVYLPELKSAIVKEAIEEHKLDWINEENAAFDKLSYAGLDNNIFIKKKDKNGMSEFDWHLYEGLLIRREKIAENTGRPSYHIANKEILKEMALHPDEPGKWGIKNGNRSPIRFGEFKTELKKLVLESEELKLSRTEPANKRLSKEESISLRKKRTLAENQKNKYFKPIQKEIIKNQGEHAATFILGNRVIAAIIAGETDDLKNYQLKLIKDNAKKLELDLSDFFPHTAI
jgi:ribonuclease D